MPTYPPNRNDAIICGRPAESFTPPAISASWNGVYAEWNGFDHYTVHMTKEAVDGLAKMSGYLFSALQKALSAASEYLAPIADAVAAYFQAEWLVIQGVSSQSQDGRVKASGYLPAMPTDIRTDAGFNPPGGYTWDPPGAESNIRFETVNSVNLVDGEWHFTAANNGSDSSRSVYFRIPDNDVNRFDVAPQDFMDAFPAVRWSSDFDSIDTCLFNPTTRTWRVFSGTNMLQTSLHGNAAIGTLDPLTSMKGLQRISKGEFGQAEKDAWAGGITAGYIDNDGSYNLSAGRRMIVLRAGDLDFHGSRGEPHDISFYFPVLAESTLETHGIYRELAPRAMWYDRTKKRDRWGFVFENKTLTCWSNQRGSYLCWLACPIYLNNENWTSWSSMANYLKSPWPWPLCPADQSVSDTQG
ncbi:hypothetical protein [Streptomyces violascens]|uniref:hypothetical protein n=1 Tax=Streptomyces violascens TaxID=67381 RepID=UPI0036B8EEFC